MQIRVREAEADDLPAVLALMRELARHEGLSSYFQLTHEALAECSLRSPKRFHVLVAASDTAILGYADARWHVETVNRPAQRFYGALGADLRDRLIAYWSQEAMRALL